MPLSSPSPGPAESLARWVWRVPCAWAIAKNSRLSAIRRSASPLLKRWSTPPTSKGRPSTWRPIWNSTMSLTRWKPGAGLCRVYAPSPPLSPAMVGGVLSLIHGERLPELFLSYIVLRRASPPKGERIYRQYLSYPRTGLDGAARLLSPGSHTDRPSVARPGPDCGQRDGDAAIRAAAQQKNALCP